MDINDLKQWLTEGLTAEQAAVVNAAIDRDSVKTRAVTLRQQSEYDAIATRAQALEAELQGSDTVPGTRAYRDWYAKNYASIKANEEAIAKYTAKYGSLEAPTPQQQQQAQPTQYTEQDIQRMVDQRIQQGYAPKWSELLTSTGGIVQKHMFAGRKTPIDFAAVGKLATEKYNGNLDQAYDEYDRPERDKAQAAATEAEITRRVNEEVAKRGAASRFPAGADSTPGSLSTRTKADLDKFDKNALMNDLASTWVNGGASS